MNPISEDPIGKLIHEFTKLPSIGEKTATRLAMHVLRQEKEYAHSLAEALISVKDRIQFCSKCFNFCEDELCSICSNDNRDKTKIAVVETPSDAMAIEKTQTFDGLFHILHGTLAPLEGIGPEDLKIKELLKRLQDDDVEEIILATNPSVEGEATSLYLAKLMKPLPLTITRLAHGLPMGGLLEFADRLTIGKAFENRIGL